MEPAAYLASLRLNFTRRRADRANAYRIELSPAARRKGLLAELAWAVWASFRDGRAPGFEQGERVTGAVSSVKHIGQVLFTDYAFAFEVTSLLIIVAMIGAVILAKRRTDT